MPRNLPLLLLATVIVQVEKGEVRLLQKLNRPSNIVFQFAYINGPGEHLSENRLVAIGSRVLDHGRSILLRGGDGDLAIRKLPCFSG